MDVMVILSRGVRLVRDLKHIKIRKSIHLVCDSVHMCMCVGGGGGGRGGEVGRVALKRSQSIFILTLRV